MTRKEKELIVNEYYKYRYFEGYSKEDSYCSTTRKQKEFAERCVNMYTSKASAISDLMTWLNIKDFKDESEKHIERGRVAYRKVYEGK